MRRGFTLVEMLVATAVFALGFTSCFALFLAGVRYRTQAEDLTRLSLASSSLINEIAIDSGKHCRLGTSDEWLPSDLPTALEPLCAPGLYIGNGRAGLAPDSSEDSGSPIYLFPYPGTGTWYRVLECTDLTGGQDPASPTLHLSLLVVSFAASGPTLDLAEVARRVGTRQRTVATEAEALLVAQELADRQVAVLVRTVILRRPSWLP